MRIEIEDRTAEVAKPVGFAFFAAGFRPFFLSAGLYAGLALPLFLLVHLGALDVEAPVTPILWHGHEMVWGFAAAVLGGFLLTAVPNWTGTPGLKGAPLAALFGLWLAGRLVWWLGGTLPAELVALVDLLFLPALAVALASPLIRAGKRRNTVFLLLLGLLWLGNLTVHLSALGVIDDGLPGVHGGIWLLILMITIIGGRIIPSFTSNGIRMATGTVIQTVSIPWLEKACVGSVLLTGLSYLVDPTAPFTGLAALVAGLLHAKRLSGWQGWRASGVPLVWVLHVGYGFLVLGLLLVGLSGLSDAVSSAAALHALTAGAIGVMTLAVMSRAALGHSGRPLEPAKATVAAYVLVALGALLRVFLPLLGLWTPEGMGLSGLLWSGGFLLFALVYWPICTRPRSDGRPG